MCGRLISFQICKFKIFFSNFQLISFDVDSYKVGYEETSLIPHWAVPFPVSLKILMNPSSPQPDPQEFLTYQNLVPSKIPAPTKRTPWLSEVPHPLLTTPI